MPAYDLTDCHAGFLAGVISAPEDDIPRLIYADWLEEHGDPTRAEFIRAQCELVRMEAVLEEPYEDQDRCTGVSANWCPVCGDCCCPEPETRKDYPACPLHSPLSRHDGDDSLRLVIEGLRRRERELLHRMRGRRWGCGEYGMALTAGYYAPDRPIYKLFPPGGGMEIANIDFRRGFVESVTCTGADWLAHGPAVVRAQPVTRVTLTDATIHIYIGGRAHIDFWSLPGEIIRCDREQLLAEPYPSEREALDAISRRCIAWAKLGDEK